MSTRAFRLGVDFGTSNTVAVLEYPDGRTRPLLFDGFELLPSAVCCTGDAPPVVGRDAIHAARVKPAGFEPHPKRTVDDGFVLLGEAEVPVVALFAAVLERVALEARRVAGVAPATVVLTCPAGWGRRRRSVLTEAAVAAGLGPVRLVAEPVAAAWHFVTAGYARIPVDRCVLVYDFGGGTFDATVLRRTHEGFDVLAQNGLPDAGGLDLDAAIVAHLGAVYAQRDPSVWARLTAPTSEGDRRAARQLLDDVRTAKEILSRSASTFVHIPLFEDDAPLGREQFDQLARPVLERTIRATRAVLRDARVGSADLAGVFLVGGSSRIPLVATLLHQSFGIAPTAIEHPELVVAEGSLQVEDLPEHDGPAIAVEVVGLNEPPVAVGELPPIWADPSALAGPDAAVAGPDAAVAGPDAAVAGPDAAVAGPDAAVAAPDAAVAVPTTSRLSRRVAVVAGITAAVVALGLGGWFVADHWRAGTSQGVTTSGHFQMLLAGRSGDGQPVTSTQIEQARGILEQRLRAAGMTGVTVAADGDRSLRVTVAAAAERSAADAQSKQLRRLVVPASLQFRKVLANTPDSANQDAGAASASPSASGPSASGPSASGPSASGTGTGGTGTGSGAATGIAADDSVLEHVKTRLGGLYAQAMGYPTPSSGQAPTPEDFATFAPFAQLSADEVAVLPAEAQFKIPTISCTQLGARPTRYAQTAGRSVVACDEKKVKYLLDVARLAGTDLKTVTSTNDQTMGRTLVLSFTASGQSAWTALTKEVVDANNDGAVAIMIDNDVVTAPTIRSVITGDALLAGAFDEHEATTLCSQLKYGALPVAFAVERFEKTS